MVMNLVIPRGIQRGHISRTTEAASANMSEQEQSPGASLAPGAKLGVEQPRGTHQARDPQGSASPCLEVYVLVVCLLCR